jgi:hypothetical protein
MPQSAKRRGGRGREIEFEMKETNKRVEGWGGRVL